MQLEDVCTHIVDCPHSTPVWLDQGIRVIRNFNLKNGTLDFTDSYFVDKETYEDRIKRIVPDANDIIFSREAPIGNVAIIPEGLKCCLGQRLVLLRANTQIVNPHYLLYCLMSNSTQYQIEQVNKSGSIVSNFNISDLKKLLLPIVEIDRQNKIVNCLSTIDKKIEINRKINAEFESMINTIYNYWFNQFEFPNEEGKPYKSNGGKMVWNEELKKEIPEGWEVKNMLEVVDWEGTSQPPKSCFIYEEKEGYIRFIQNRDYDTNEHLTYIPIKMAKGICNEYDILIDKYGDAGRIRYGLAGAYNVALSKIVVKENINREYIRSYLSSKQVYSYLHESSMASTRASLNQNNISFLKLVIPQCDILKQFNEIALLKIKDYLLRKNETIHLNNLRDFLIPLLMNGQIIFKESNQ